MTTTAHATYAPIRRSLATTTLAFAVALAPTMACDELEDCEDGGVRDDAGICFTPGGDGDGDGRIPWYVNYEVTDVTGTVTLTNVVEEENDCTSTTSTSTVTLADDPTMPGSGILQWVPVDETLTEYRGLADFGGGPNTTVTAFSGVRSCPPADDVPCTAPNVPFFSSVRFGAPSDDLLRAAFTVDDDAATVEMWADIQGSLVTCESLTELAPMALAVDTITVGELADGETLTLHVDGTAPATGEGVTGGTITVSIDMTIVRGVGDRP